MMLAALEDVADHIHFCLRQLHLNRGSFCGYFIGYCCILGKMIYF